MYFKKLNPDLTSPYQHYQWEIGKEVTINNFDTSNRCCSTRLYYLNLDQLLFCPAKPIFEVKIGGQIKKFEEKNGCSRMTVVREVPKDEILSLIKEANLDQKLGYKYGESIYPVNPFEIRPPNIITREIIEKLMSWTLVHNSTVFQSIKNYSAVDLSVWESFGNLFFRLILDSLHNSGIDIEMYNTGEDIDSSVTDIIENYVLFSLLSDPNLSIDPRKIGTDLWYLGLIPSYDGEKWRLHGGPEAQILYEMTEN